MEAIKAARQLINKLLDELDIDSYDARIDKNLWGIHHNKAGGHIAISVNREDPNLSIIYVSFRIMNVPLSSALPFYRKILDLNERYFGMQSFSVDSENLVWLTSGRLVQDLDFSEVMDMVMRAGYFADKAITELLEEFGEEYAAE